jgi:hypothetical protein
MPSESMSRGLEAADEVVGLRAEDAVDVDRRPFAGRLVVELHHLR